MMFQRIQIGVLVLMIGLLPFFRTSAVAQSTTTGKVIKLVYYDHAMPLSFVEDGKVTGILIDVINAAIAKRMKIEVSHAAYPWERAQSMVQSGEADAFVTVPTDKRKEYTNVSDEVVVEMIQSIYVKKNNPKIDKIKAAKSIDDLKPLGLTVGSYLGSGWNREKLAGFTMLEAPNAENILLMMKAGRVDIFISPALSVNYLIKKMDLKEEIAEIPTTWGTAYFHLCIGKKSPFVGILPKFSEEIRDMKMKKEIDVIISNYR